MKEKKANTKKSLTTLLKECGFVLPITEEDIVKYEETFGATEIILPEDIANPDFLFKGSEKILPVSKASPVKGKVISIELTKKNHSALNKQNDYFKKLVLAAEIANQLYIEPTFGHKKFVKIEYLCTEICNMKLSTNYGKYAAGPLDPKHMYSVDAEFRRRGWFVITKRSGSYGYKYSPGQNIEGYKKYYTNYFKNQHDSINKIISLFRKMDSAFCEIVATLFYVWKEKLQFDRSIDDELLIKAFYEWSEEKKRFSKKELFDGLIWMKSNEIVPI